jgi:hypothetical protein
MSHKPDRSDTLLATEAMPIDQVPEHIGRRSETYVRNDVHWWAVDSEARQQKRSTAPNLNPLPAIAACHSQLIGK